MSKIRIVFNDVLDDLSAPDPTSFTVEDSTMGIIVITDVEVIGKNIIITTKQDVHGMVTIVYNRPSSKPISNRLGYRSKGFKGFFDISTTPPVLRSATVNGSTIRLTYNEDLNKSSIPASSAFKVLRY